MADKKSKFVKGGVVLRGEVKFNNISEARSFKLKDGTMTDAKYDLMLLFAPDSDEVKVLEDLHAQAVEFELASVPANKRKSIGTRPLKLDMDVDKDGNETGLMKITLTRSEKAGPPKLIDNQNIEISRKFLTRGSTVRVQITALSYNVAGMAGMSLRLEGIQLITEAASTGGGGTKLVFETVPGSDLGGTDKSPF